MRSPRRRTACCARSGDHGPLSLDAEDRLAAAVTEGSDGATLFAGFGPAASADAPHATVFQDDLRTHMLCEAAGVSSTFGAWLPPQGEPFDAAVVRMPRAAERLRMTLAMVRGLVRPGGAVTVVGHNDGGIRAAPRDVRALIGEPEVVSYRWHCRAVRATASITAQPTSLADFETTWAHDGIEVHSYPGVFAHGRLDPGTALLLRALGADADIAADARVLDLGCGSGLLAAWAGARGATADAVDTDALAVEAARATGAPYGVRAYASDLYSAATGPYTHIISNPPFHKDGRIALGAARALIAGAPAHLAPKGELWLVVNRFLDHTDALREGFASFEMAAEDGRYRVWRARRR